MVTSRAILFAILSLGLPLLAQTSREDVTNRFPETQWEEINPRVAGWDTNKLDHAASFAARSGATSLLVVQHGRIIARMGDIAERTELHSGRKSFLSALFGIAVTRRQLTLDESLESLRIDDIAPSLTPQEKQATVRDLLEARSGIYHASAYETKDMAEKRPERGSHAPGAFWYYNNWDFNTLGAIYELATGQSIFDALQQEIAQPIGMQDFRPQDGRYLRDPLSRFPAYPMRMSTRDLARFVLLYLHRGAWMGQQVIPAAWIEASVHPWSDTESGGYGYLWWTGDPATPGFKPKYSFPTASFWLEGHLGQYAIAIPQRDLVIVFRVKGDHPAHTIKKRQAADIVRMIAEAAPS